MDGKIPLKKFPKINKSYRPRDNRVAMYIMTKTLIFENVVRGICAFSDRSYYEGEWVCLCVCVCVYVCVYVWFVCVCVCVCVHVHDDTN